MIDVIRKIHSPDLFLSRYRTPGALLLNAGSSRTDFGEASINVDIQQKAGVHCRCDVQRLPFADSAFDIAILSAVLQYCKNPTTVVGELARVLKADGLLYVDAPFIQPYCPDTPDLYRFTQYGLLELFQGHFQVEECGPSIPGSSALAFYIRALVTTNRLKNRYLRGALALATDIALLPLSMARTNRDHRVAGAIFLVGRNRKGAVEARETASR